jgi:hypothetical protein
MINTQDQEELFRLIADYLEEDIKCVAIGGTAMMFQGYKTTTKDIDLVFQNQNRIKNNNKPLLYSRGDERFDLFLKDVFGFEIEFDKFVQRHDFIGKKELIVFTLSKEYLILLKAITNREKDYEDIETIVKIEKNMDWNIIIDAAIPKRKQIVWILHDLEETMQKLKKIVFIKKENFDKIYAAEEKYK